MDKPLPVTDEFFKEAIHSLGLDTLSEGQQQTAIVMLGENILARVTLEIAKALPKEKLSEFEKLMDGGDPQAINNFLTPYIPSLPAFVEMHARREVESTREQLHAAPIDAK